MTEIVLTCRWCGRAATHRVPHRYSRKEREQLRAFRASFSGNFCTAHLPVSLLVLPGTTMNLCDLHHREYVIREVHES